MVSKTAAMAVLLSAAASLADDGDRIDQCQLGADGALHCSTANRRSAAAFKAVLAKVEGFDRDERTEEVSGIAVVWLTAQKGACRKASIDVTNDVMNAYAYPGLSPGMSAGLTISQLEGCTRAFTTWLFKRENHGLPPGMVAFANTVLQNNLSDGKGATTCLPKWRALFNANRAWLQFEQTHSMGEDGWPGEALYNAMQKAMAALNACDR